MKRHVYVYMLCVTLCIRSMYNIYEKEAGEGCFSNIPFQRLIPKSNKLTYGKDIRMRKDYYNYIVKL